ncbi:MAG: hypothetical protein ACFFFB_14980 [Candidatus Heimdallarchaeota archaeon]
MKGSIISRKYSWFLAKVTASIINFENIVIVNQETIKKYDLLPGRYIKISSLFQDQSNKRFLDKFILLPYFQEIANNYWLLRDVIQSLANNTYHYLDKEYISQIIKLMSCFYQASTNKSKLKLEVLLEFEEEESDQMRIALPESWLNEHSIDLGETVVLRNDFPSPIIF